MAMIGRDEAVLAAAALFALLMPLALLLPFGTLDVPAPKPAPPPLTASAASPLAAAYERPLFGAAADSSNDASPTDAPSLLGIIGRLNEDAVALVRTADGTRALKIGDSIDGWRLASLSIDAAFFTRGTERVRVPMPTE